MNTGLRILNSGYKLLDNPDTIVLAVMLGVIGVAVVVAVIFSEIHRRRAARRSSIIEAVAKRRDWEYQRSNPDVSLQIVDVLRPSTVVNFGLPVVKKVRPLDLTDFVFIPDAGIVVCDCVRWFASDKRGGCEFATMLYACDSSVTLPHFGVLPLTLGDRIASGVGLPGSKAVEHKPFDQRYRLHGAPADDVHKLLCPDGLELLSKRKNFLVEGWDQHVVIAYSPLFTSEQSFFGSANDRRIGLDQEKHFERFVEDASSLSQLIFAQARLYEGSDVQAGTS